MAKTRRNKFTYPINNQPALMQSFKRFFFKFNRINTLYSKLNFEVLKQPDNIKQLKCKIIIISIISDVLFSIFSFSLKGAQIAINYGYVGITIALLLLYFSDRIVGTSFDTYRELLNDNFYRLYSSESIEILMNISAKVRSKVFKTDDTTGNESMIENAELLKRLKDYLNAVWNFWWILPIMFAKVISLSILILGTIIIEFQENSLVETLPIMILLIVCTVIYFLLGKQRINLIKSFRKQRRDCEAKEEVLYNEIKVIEFFNSHDYDYHCNRFRKTKDENCNLITEERFKLNQVFIKRSIVATVFIFAILFIKIYQSGTLNSNIVLDVVAVSGIYATILSKITSILSIIESVMDYVIDIDKLSPDFQNIHSVYQLETVKNISSTYVDSISVGPFSVSYDNRNHYVLANTEAFALNKGEFILVEGPTGCGKSTLLKLLCGNMRIATSPITFSNGEIGYLKSLNYQTDRALANNFILNEIILADTFDNLDIQMLFEILHGLNLYGDFKRMANRDSQLSSLACPEDRILEFMKSRQYEEFSSGQKQRIALAKLLYNLDSEIQVICLDEAFNRLDDETAKHCVDFIANFVQRDIPRIVFFATHQVSIVRPICSKQVTFIRDLEVSRIVVKNL